MRMLSFVALFVSWPLLAHEVIVATGTTSATVVQLNYADGQPFAFEAYELYPVGHETPVQVGRTDSAGRVVFVASDGQEYRLKAWSTDGHGVERRVLAEPSGADVSIPPPASRAGLLMTGLGGIFGLFGLWQLYLRKRHA